MTDALEDTREFLLQLNRNGPTRLFDRLDAGDESHVRDVSILVDMPEVVSVARFLFWDGTVAYEVLHSEIADEEDYADVVAVVGRHHLIHYGPYGYTLTGRHRFRALFLEREQVRKRKLFPSWIAG